MMHYKFDAMLFCEKELRPTDGRKSCYGKAKIRVYEDGSEVLVSYNTPIVRKDANGKMWKMWNGWSYTTGRHIRYYCGLNKHGYYQLPAYAE